MKFLSLSRRRSSRETSPAAKSGEKRMFSQDVWNPESKTILDYLIRGEIG